MKTKKKVKIHEKGALPKNILRFSPVKGKKIHQTLHTATFHIDLIEYLIKGFSKENSIVIDPFIGSGTVALASEKLNRKWIGIEISDEYCDICIERIRTVLR